MGSPPLTQPSRKQQQLSVPRLIKVACKTACILNVLFYKTTGMGLQNKTYQCTALKFSCFEGNSQKQTAKSTPLAEFFILASIFHASTNSTMVPEWELTCDWRLHHLFGGYVVPPPLQVGSQLCRPQLEAAHPRHRLPHPTNTHANKFATPTMEACWTVS